MLRRRRFERISINGTFGLFSITFLALVATPLLADDSVRLQETFVPGRLFHVSMRVTIDGQLSLPADKGQTSGKELKIDGKSSIDYDERILKVDKLGKVSRTIRKYQRMDFERNAGNQLQKTSLRSAISRLVVMRHNHLEVPFSPDGPLTWGEIDLVRTDVFTPALRGLLANKLVQSGDRWTASTSAVQELTDFNEIDKGAVACKLESVTTLAGQPQARVSFQGTVHGVSEDGKGVQALDGYYYFNLEDNFLSYLSMKGTHYLVNADGKTVGKIVGNFVLTRQPLQSARGINNSDLSGIDLEPNDKNTQLLFDDADLGLRLEYPRRWHVAGSMGRQLGLDEKGGSGMLLTLEAPNRVPTGNQFLKESHAWLTKQKAKILKVIPAQSLQKAPRPIEHFVIDIDVGKEKFRMYYLVVRDANGGAVIAARLKFDDLANLQREVQQIARSIQLTRKQ